MPRANIKKYICCGVGLYFMADMKVNMVTDMEIDKVLDMEVDMLADKEVGMVADMEVTIRNLFWDTFFFKPKHLQGQTFLNLTFKVQLAHLLNFASLFKLETKPYCSDFFMKDWVVSFV